MSRSPQPHPPHTVCGKVGHPGLTPVAMDAAKQWGYKPYLVDGNPVAVSLWRFIKQGCPKGIASSPRTCCATRSSLGSRARFRTSSCCKHGGCQLCFVAASIVRLILRRDRSQSIMAQDPPYSLIDLGHRSVRITDKHYSPRVAARHEQLESDVRRTWDTNLPVLAQTKDTPEVHGRNCRSNRKK